MDLSRSIRAVLGVRRGSPRGLRRASRITLADSKRWLVVLAASAVVAGAALAGCAEQRRSKLPPPVYERPTLPPWQPPQAEAPEDALDGAGGEWVDEPPGGTQKTGGVAPGAAGAPAR